MFRNVAILVIICTLNGTFADDIPNECKVHQAFKELPHELWQFQRAFLKAIAVQKIHFHLGTICGRRERVAIDYRNVKPLLLRPHECCDIPRLVSEQDEKDCGLPPDCDMSIEQSHPRPPVPPSCDSEICLLKKYDLLSGDNKVNKKAVVALIETWSTDEPELAPLIDSIKSECVDKDLTATGPPDVCEPLKMRRCLMKTVILECPKWKATEQCTEIKQHFDKCKQYFKKAA